MPRPFDIRDPEGNVIGRLNAPDEATPEQVEAAAASVVSAHKRGVPFSKTAAGVRVVGGLTGMFGGVPGAVGAGTAEVLAEGIEKAQGVREALSVPQIATQAGLGAIPGLPAGAGGALARVGRQAAGGALLGGGGAAATDIAEGRVPTLGNVGMAAGLGLGLGGVMGGRTEQIRRRIARMQALQEGQAPALVRHPETGELVPPEALAPGPPVAAAEAPPVGPRAISDEDLISQELAVGLEPEVTAQPGEIVEPRVKPELTDAMTARAQEDIAETARALAGTEASQEGKRLFLQLADAFETGTLSSQDVLQVIQKEGMTVPQFLQHWKETISTAGLQLNRLGRLQRELNIEARRNPELMKVLEEAGAVRDPVTGEVKFFKEDPGFWLALHDQFTRFDNFTRASIVAQTATTMRNIESQIGRYSLDAWDTALQTTMAGRPVGDAAREMLGYLQSAMRAIRPKEMQKISAILDEFPIEAQQLIQLPAGEVALSSKYTRLINTFNRFQEHYFRRAGFDVRLRQLLREGGIDVEQALANPKTIPLNMIQEATNHALELTFVAPPHGEMGKGLMQLWVAARPLASPTFPFPRFMINAYKFLTDFSPAALFRLFGYKPENLMMNPKLYRQVASRMQLGTLMLGGALAIRNDPELRGPKWYQMRLSRDGPMRDVRALAPFGTFLFYAEMIRQQAENGRMDMTANDMIQGTLSINRLAGTGLVAADLLAGRGSAKARWRLIQDGVAQYVGRVTVPFRTPKDWVAQFSPEEALARSTREPVEIAGRQIPLLAPALGNIPFLSRVLPPLASPLRENPRRALNPLARQLGAPTQVDLNPIENAVAELGLEFREIIPSSGIRKFDRLTADVMGKIVAGPFQLTVGNRNMTGTELVESPEFKEASALIRKLELKDFLSQARGLATKVTLRRHPEFIPELWFNRQKPEVRELLQESGFDKIMEQMQLGAQEGTP